MAKVEKITLDLGDGVQVELTLEKAKELHRVLNDLFGASDTPAKWPISPTLPPYPRYTMPEPIQTPPRNPDTYPNEYRVWCSDGRG